MPAPTLTPLPSAPTRANPATFAARADAFMTALPTFATQVNALVAYWNAELDTTAFVNRGTPTTLTATMTFTAPPVLLASATSGEQAALTVGKGTTQRQQFRIANDGSLNIVPLNGATAQLRINNQEVYHTGNLPSAGDVGAVPSGSYTAADVRAKLLTVDGAGSGVDADLLDGQHGSYYLNASMLNAGTVPDARLPSNIVRSTRRVNSGDGLSGGAALTSDVSLSVDGTVARRNAANTYTGHQYFQSGSIHLDAASTTNTMFWLRTNGGAARALIWAAGASDLLRLRAYNVAGDAFQEATMNGANGRFTAPEFAGGGSALIQLNASAIDRGTIPDARLASNIVRSDRNINTGGGLQGGRSLAGDMTLSVDATVVRTTRTISAGNGLTGGGNLGGNIAVSLGTPSSITPDSSNSVTATSHTHALTRETVGELTSRLGAGAIGTYGAFKRNIAGNVQAGAVLPGSQLEWSAFNGASTGVGSPTGSWRCMGAATSYNGTTDPNNATLFMRVS